LVPNDFLTLPRFDDGNYLSRPIVDELFENSLEMSSFRAVIGERRYRARPGTGWAVESTLMSNLPVETAAPPRAHARVVYLGPVSPHWEVYSEFGDQTVVSDFRTRVLARLVLVPRDDPQFRRNKERIVRDAEREGIVLEWDLGLPADSVA
jgi:hypothetical protein